MIDFDQDGIGECPRCEGWISKEMHYCGHCGIRLPLPSNLQDFIEDEKIEKRLKALLRKVNKTGDESPVAKLVRIMAYRFHNHQLMKEEFKFCTKCGKKV